MQKAATKLTSTTKAGTDAVAILTADHAKVKEPRRRSSGSPIDVLPIMKVPRTRPAAWLALLAVFFAQLATAAYACPMIAEALEMRVANLEAVTPCAGMRMAVGLLFKVDRFTTCLSAIAVPNALLLFR